MPTKKIRLICCALCACVLVGCGAGPEDGFITEEQAQHLQVGVTKDELLSTLGRPYGGTDNPAFVYRIQKNGYVNNVYIFFSNGRADKITRD